MSEYKIQVKNLHKAFGKKVVLDGVDIEIKKGESLVVIGGSGTGKSVLIKCIQGLLNPDEGSIKVDGIEINGADESVRDAMHAKMGMLFQGGALFDSLSVWENVAFGLIENQKWNRKDAKTEAIRVLRQVGLAPDVADLSPSELSGGMQQRVMIAMALAGKPQLLIADEPTTALDVTIQAQILELLKELKEKLDMAILLISHNLGVVGELADHIGVMYAGKIVETGRAEDIISSPRHPYTKALLNAVPLLGNAGKKLQTIPGMVPQVNEYPAGCRFSTRCAFCTEKCRNEIPSEIEVSPGHKTACFFVEGDLK